MITIGHQITLKQIIEILEDISQKHGQIKAFFAGDISNYHPIEGKYPLMYVHNSNSYLKLSEIEYDVEIFILDRLETDQSNLNEVLSDTLQICADVRSLLKFGNELYNLIRIDDALQQQSFGTQLTRVTDSINDDIVAGWQMTLKIRVDYINNICTIPNINGTTYQLP